MQGQIHASSVEGCLLQSRWTGEKRRWDEAVRKQYHAKQFKRWNREVEIHNIEKKKTKELICINISIPRHNDQPKGPAIYSNLKLLLKNLKLPLCTHMFLSSRLWSSTTVDPHRPETLTPSTPRNQFKNLAQQTPSLARSHALTLTTTRLFPGIACQF